MSTEDQFIEAVRLLAAGLGMTGGEEDTSYLRQIHDRLTEIKTILQQGHDASEAIRAEAEAVLEAHAESARDYLQEQQEPDAPDPHPFVSVPAGATARELPDGGRLLTLADGAMVRVSTDGTLVAIGHDGAVATLEPTRRGIVTLPDGRELTLKRDAVRTTHEAAGIEGLPLDVDPVQIAEGRYRVELPGGVRLDLSHPDRTAVLGNPDGTVDVLAIHRIEGIGEEIEVRPVPGGARGFAARGSGHRGIVEADGTIHLSLANGLDLVIRFPDASDAAPDGDDGPPAIICQERD